MRAALRDPDVVYRRRWLTLLVLCISLIVITLDNTILNVALPTLAHPVSEGGLGATASQLQWIVDAYTLVFAGLLLTAGSLGDRFGRYRFLAIGLVDLRHRLAAVGVRPASADDADLHPRRSWASAARSSCRRRCRSSRTSSPTRRERGKAIGVWAGVSALGIGLGPITGGFLLEHFWWGSVFIVNVPIVIAGLVLGYFLVPESKDPSHAALDPVGAVLSIVALGSILWAVIEAPSHGWGSPEIVAGFVVGFAVLARVLRLGAALERTRCSTCTSSRTHGSARRAARSRSCSSSLFGTLFLLTQYLQSVLGYSTVEGRRGAAPAGRHADDLRSAVERVGAALRQQDGRHRPACSSWRTSFVAVPRRSTPTAARCTSSA